MNHVLCDGGLCNRLNALIFALTLKQRFGDDWKISWPLNNWCGAAFGQLFESALPVDELSIEDYKSRQDDCLLLMHENQIGFRPDRLILNKELTSYDQYARYLSEARSGGLDLVYFNSLLPPFVTDDDVAKALTLLRVESKVASAASAFVKDHRIDRSTVGLHIRKTDFGSAVDDQAWFEQARSSSRRFFVCSDDAEVNQRFSSLAHCSVYPKSSFPEKLEANAPWQHWTTDAQGRRFPFNVNRSSASVVDGLVDLLILSCTEIVPTSGSTFLATAKLFGRCGFLEATEGVDSTAPKRSDLEQAMNPVIEPVRQERSPAASSQRPVLPSELFDLLNTIRPWQLISDVKVRIGADADGGYVLPSSCRRSNTVLSIGIGTEVSFDTELAEAGARVLQFDHTVAAAPLVRPGVHFHQLGWGPRDEHPFVSLASMVRMIDWSGARHPILKFDAEGAEWDCLASASTADIARFEVLTGEFHAFDRLPERAFFDRALAVFRKLESTHRVVHLHANNAGGMVMLGGIAFPRLLELTFVRKSTASFHGHSSEPIPGPLDRPNISHLPDLHLRAF